ncbi:MAG: type II toxin-antitoxin system death-on-curing family toxin, partial [Cyanobacteriota bacterium]
EDLYPGLLEKAAALGFSIMMNHPFVDGNKRTGHAAIETFLVLNGLEINASVDAQERVVLAIVSGELEREVFVEWLQQHTAPANNPNAADS